MQVLKADSATIEDLKQLLNDQKINTSNLGITANLG